MSHVHRLGDRAAEPGLVSMMVVELQRAPRRPLAWACLAWSVVAGVVAPLLVLAVASRTAGVIVLLSAYATASLGTVPALVWGLIAGDDDARYHVARDLHLAGICEVTDVGARAVVAALAMVAQWVVGVLAATAVTLGLVVAGRVALRAATVADPSLSMELGVQALAIGLVSLPLLSAACVLVAVWLRSPVGAAALALGTTAIWFASVSFVNTLPHLLWVARFTPLGAAYQIATLATFPRGDERFAVGVWTALLAGAVWFVIMPVIALRGVSGPRGRAAPRRRLIRRWPRVGMSVKLVQSPVRALLWLVLAAFCIGCLSEAGELRGRASYDAAYQLYARERERDIVVRVGEHVRNGDWGEVSALVGVDIREAAPAFVAYVREHPDAHLALVGVEDGERHLWGLEVQTLMRGDEGVMSWSGPDYLFEMRFEQGRWWLQRVVDRR